MLDSKFFQDETLVDLTPSPSPHGEGSLNLENWSIEFHQLDDILIENTQISRFKLPFLPVGTTMWREGLGMLQI